MKNQIRSKIVKRLRVLSWLHAPGYSVRRHRAPLSKSIWLGAGLLFDLRTGLIKAL